MSDIQVSVGLDTTNVKTNSTAYIKSLDDMIKIAEKVEKSNERIQKSLNDTGKASGGQAAKVNKFAAAVGSLSKATTPFIKAVGTIRKANTAFSGMLKSLNTQTGKMKTAYNKLGTNLSKVSGKINEVTSSLANLRGEQKKVITSTNAFTKSIVGGVNALKVERIATFNVLQAKMAGVLDGTAIAAQKAAKAQEALKKAQNAATTKVYKEAQAVLAEKHKAVAAAAALAAKKEMELGKAMNRDHNNAYNKVQARLAKHHKDVAKAAAIAAKAQKALEKSLAAKKVKELAQEEARLVKQQKAMASSAEKAAAAQEKLARTQGETGRRLGTNISLWRELRGVVGAYAAINVVKSIIDTNAAFIGLEAALTAVTGSQAGAGRAMTLVRGLANDLGLNLRALADGYKQLTASAKGANFPMAESDRIFKAVATASRTLNLSVEDTKGTIKALSQIISKGTVEESELSQAA